MVLARKSGTKQSINYAALLGGQLLPASQAVSLFIVFVLSSARQLLCYAMHFNHGTQDNGINVFNFWHENKSIFPKMFIPPTMFHTFLPQILKFVFGSKSVV